MERRDFLVAISVAAIASGGVAAAAEPRIAVYKSPACGCCGKWVEHLRQGGFSVTVNDVGELGAYRAKAGVPNELASCHTALVEGYVVEGHVPAGDIRSLLESRPKALGLAVPGMPKGSPGMEAPKGEAFDVLLFQADGTVRVYRSYPRT